MTAANVDRNRCSVVALVQLYLLCNNLWNATWPFVVVASSRCDLRPNNMTRVCNFDMTLSFVIRIRIRVRIINISGYDWNEPVYPWALLRRELWLIVLVKN